MKVLVCPDIHQDLLAITYCINELRKGNCDKVVFLGDVIDSWSSKEWYANEFHSPSAVLKQLADWKFEFGDKFICLVGNHDWSYMRIHDLRMTALYEAISVSGHQYEYMNEINALFNQYEDIFQLAVCIDGVVYSHAGFTDKWLKSYLIYHRYNNERPKNFQTIYNEIVSNIPLLIDQLNSDFKNEKMQRSWLDHRSHSPIGDDPMEGPLWVRPDALIHDAAFPFQVVGHTEYYEVKPFNNKKSTRFILIVDTPSHNQCVTITNGNIINFEKHSVTYDDVSHISEWS